jgi:hypothetical protein
VIVYRKQVFEFFISMTMIVYQNRVWIFWEPRSWTRWSALIPGGCLVQYLLAHGTRGLFSSSRMDRFLDTSEDTHFHVPDRGKASRKEKKSSPGVKTAEPRVFPRRWGAGGDRQRGNRQRSDRWARLHFKFKSNQVTAPASQFPGRPFFTLFHLLSPTQALHFLPPRFITRPFSKFNPT